MLFLSVSESPVGEENAGLDVLLALPSRAIPA